MGPAQSKLPESAMSEALAERLEALEVKEISQEMDKDYVYVRGGAPNTMHTFSPQVTQPWSPTLSVSVAEQWEKELMEDPKV